MRNDTTSRFVAPALIVIAVLAAITASWINVVSEFSTVQLSLKEFYEEDVFVRWVWISGIGAILVLASAFVGDTMRKRLAQAGAFLAVVLPVRSLIEVFTEDAPRGASFEAGLGLWVTLAATILAVGATYLMPDDKDPVPTTPVIQQ